MPWFVFSGVICGLSFIVSAYMSVETPWYWLIFAAGLSQFFVLISGLKCPSCRFGLVDDTRGYYTLSKGVRPYCPQCGRSRKGVWPYQYTLYPEKWDGRCISDPEQD
jgi:hypothetical protein